MLELVECQPVALFILDSSLGVSLMFVFIFILSRSWRLITFETLGAMIQKLTVSSEKSETVDPLYSIKEQRRNIFLSQNFLRLTRWSK